MAITPEQKAQIEDVLVRSPDLNADVRALFRALTSIRTICDDDGLTDTEKVADILEAANTGLDSFDGRLTKIKDTAEAEATLYDEYGTSIGHHLIEAPA